MSTFETLLEERNRLDQNYREACQRLNTFPKRANGLTPDEVKASPEWKAAKQTAQANGDLLRAANRHLNKYFKAELREYSRGPNGHPMRRQA